MDVGRRKTKHHPSKERKHQNRAYTVNMEKLIEPEFQVKYHQVLTKKLNEKIVTIIVGGLEISELCKSAVKESAGKREPLKKSSNPDIKSKSEKRSSLLQTLNCI